MAKSRMTKLAKEYNEILSDIDQLVIESGYDRYAVELRDIAGNVLYDLMFKLYNKYK